MPDHAKSWLTPEEALTRFKKPQTSLLNQQDVIQTESSSRYGFVIKNIGFLIAEKTLSEVVKNAHIFPIPNSQSWMRGLINLRGNLVPVYDLPLMTGLKDEMSQIDNLLVLGKGAESIGLLIDRLPQTCDISQWQKLSHTPCLLEGLEEYVTEAYSNNDIVWVDFNENEYFESVKQQIAL